MQTFTDEIMGELLASRLETASLEADGWRDTGTGPAPVHGRYVRWLTFSDNEQSVLDDVERIREHPLVPGDIPIHGCIYDCASGELHEVAAASEAGRARRADRPRRIAAQAAGCAAAAAAAGWVASAGSNGRERSGDHEPGFAIRHRRQPLARARRA